MKIELIKRLVGAGLTTVEATAFVSPKWVPQMADHGEILRDISKWKHAKSVSATFPVLVPNMKGLESAMDCDVEEIAIFASASEAFSKKNINCSVLESIERFKPVCKVARDRGIRVRG